jgi:hypothetical protein
MSENANGVIETATGDLLRAGFCNFEHDSGTESLRYDVPCPFYVRGKKNLPTFHRWDGNAWIEVANA